MEYTPCLRKAKAKKQMPCPRKRRTQDSRFFCVQKNRLFCVQGFNPSLREAVQRGPCLRKRRTQGIRFFCVQKNRMFCAKELTRASAKQSRGGLAPPRKWRTQGSLVFCVQKNQLFCAQGLTPPREAEKQGALPPEAANARQSVFLCPEKPAVLRQGFNPSLREAEKRGTCPHPAKRRSRRPCPR